MNLYYEIEEMACAILGLDYETLCDEGREEKIEEKVYEKLNVDMEQFTNVVKALLPFTPVVKSAICNIKYHAFVNEKEGSMIIKQEVEA